jgi:hypothetical protein
MRAGVGPVLLACAAGASAPAAAWAETAREPAAPMSLASERFLDAPGIPGGRSLSDQIAAKLTLLGTAIDAHLGGLTLDALDFRIDGAGRRARVRLNAAARRLALCLDGNVRFERGLARVATRVDLAVGGGRWQLQLPEIELVPRSHAGEHYVEIRLPLLEGTF